MPYKVNHVKSNGGRYLFISVCILSTFFSVLLLLMILSKVVIFAKKSAYPHTRSNHFGLEEMAFRRRGVRRPRERRNFSLVPENAEVSNPLLIPYRWDNSCFKSVVLTIFLLVFQKRCRNSNSNLSTPILFGSCWCTLYTWWSEFRRSTTTIHK